MGIFISSLNAVQRARATATRSASDPEAKASTAAIHQISLHGSGNHRKTIDPRVSLEKWTASDYCPRLPFRSAKRKPRHGARRPKINVVSLIVFPRSQRSNVIM